jgi:Carboxypeptidase regulatory-like domain
MNSRRKLWFTALALVSMFVPAHIVMGQVDQGTITGVIQDTTGAVIPKASVTLTSIDQGWKLRTLSDGSGVYVFSPIKIGDYEVTASAPNFVTTTQTNLHLNIQQRLNVVIVLKAGAASQTVTVTTQAPLMQTQESSVGQTMSTQEINNVPLNGRNWVYIAQLAPGATPPSGSRGQDKGDFNANGQRAEENNFILDGVDNNANVVDFYNGASYVAQPPPDALAEFKVQTSDYSAEFGHSAGAVVNASIKSGSNHFHGSLWEYLRNTAFDTYDWDQHSLAEAGNPVPAYHENQFGATLGGPILRNKLFFFGDAQANRVVFNETTTENVPTDLERAGDFSQLLNSSLTGDPAVQLYNQTPNAPPVPFANNCLVTSSYCTSNVSGVALNQTALAILKDYPEPNTNGGNLYSNYVVTRPITDNTFQWDARADWTIGSKDSTYSRYSYWNEVGYKTPPLGNILDGGGFGDDGTQKIYGANYMWSETHIFTPTLTNEVRFGFNYLHTGFQQPNAANLNFAASVGFGGIPVAPLNGGLPAVGWSGNDTNTLSGFGSPTWATTDEHNNVFQILDNVTKIAGNHTLKAGVSFENIRFSTLQPQQSRGSYTYNGTYTSNLGAANTGFGLADFLLDMQNSAGLSNEVTNGDQRSDNAVYFQDDWRVMRRLTLNLGLRWELFQPYQDVGGYQASYNITSKPTLNTTTGYGSASAQYLIPSEAKSYAAPIISQFGYDQVLAKDNVNIVYTGNPRLLNEQHTNFAPRVGLAWSPDSKTAIRAGFGIFYGGLESIGYWPNLGENYPFQFTGSFYSPSCGTYNCGTDGITIENGFSTIIKNGFASNVEDLTARGSDPSVKTPYTEDWNLSIERAITSNISATIAYVGDASHHLQVLDDPNSSLALENSANSIQNARPLPDFGGSSYTTYVGMSDYNSLQAKLEKRMSNGLNFLTSYTWGHSLDDAPTPLGSTDDSGVRNPNLIPIKMDYSQSGFDTRQRLTFNALYDLPFGKGRAYLNQNGVLDEIAGGWSANAMWVAQTGNYFTVGTSGTSNASGFENGPFAYQIHNEYATGGGSGCPTTVKTRQHWYNPCSYANPWSSDDPVNQPSHYIPKSATDPNTPAGDTTPVYVQSLSSVLGYAGGKRDNASGPGYERVNMSIFKSFPTYREEKLTFRADIFNLFNTPSLGLPASTNTSTGSGYINGPRNLQEYAPDARFIQLSLRYAF